MLEAIEKARRFTFKKDEKVSKTFGLRAIKRFEKVNNVIFDPFNQWHVLKITCNGPHERFFRRMKFAKDDYFKAKKWL